MSIYIYIYICVCVCVSTVCGKGRLLCEHFHAHCCREIVVLPKRDQHGNIVMAGRLVDVDASKFNYDDCLKSWFMLQDVTLLEHGAVPGFVFVVDMKGTSLGHITKMSLSSIKKYYMYIQVQSPIFPYVVSEYKISFVLSSHTCSCYVVT
jgi:hypothetical protein